MRYVICFLAGAVVALALVLPSLSSDAPVIEPSLPGSEASSAAPQEDGGASAPPIRSLRDASNRPGPRRAAEVPALPALSEAILNEILSVTADVDPETAKLMRAEQRRNPAQFETIVRQRWPMLAPWIELRRNDPQLYQDRVAELRIDKQIRQHSAELREAIAAESDDEAAMIERQLRGALMMQIAFAIKSRGDYILKLREHLQNLQTELDEMAANMETLIDERVAAIKAGNDSASTIWRRRSGSEGEITNRNDPASRATPPE